MSRKRKIFVNILVAFLVFFLVVFPFFAISFLYKETKAETKQDVFLEIWNIDTFEGGTKSRHSFLQSNALKFQKANDNVLIVVRSLSKEQAKIQLENGVTPDLVSFGIGAGNLFSAISEDVSFFNVRNDLKSDKAVAWCMGGYVLCSYEDLSLLSEEEIKNKTLGYSAENNTSLLALESFSSKFALYDESLSQYDAYTAFLEKKFDVLLGSQRDFARFQNRLNLGSLSSCYFTFLTGYSDLVQYFAITTTEENKEECLNEFIAYILSDDVQSSLSNIGMFSVTNLSIYDGEYQSFESALQEEVKTLNPFLFDEEIAEIQEKARANYV